MKVIVSKNLNVRVGAPSLEAPCYQYLAPGSELEVDGKTYKGDKYDGIDTWYKDEAGNYYWSGGINNMTDESKHTADLWYEKLQIKSINEKFGEYGQNAKALVIDSGINAELGPFHGRIIEYKQFPVTLDTRDNSGHGTHCAGLICSESSAYSIGIANKAQLYIAKISDGQINDAGSIKMALEEFLKDEYRFDVISLSQQLPQEDRELYDLIGKHVEKNRIVLAAIGNDSLRQQRKLIRFPGSFDNVISVGAVDNDLKAATYTCSPDKVHIFTYGTDISSYRHSELPEPLTGTSQACAIAAGISCLIVSFMKSNGIRYSQDSFRKLLKQYSRPVDKPFSHLPLLAPEYIFDKLKIFLSYDNKDLQACLDRDNTHTS